MVRIFNFAGTQFTFSLLADIIVELLPGYHDLEATLNIIDTDNRTLTFRALYGKEVHVVRL